MARQHQGRSSWRKSLGLHARTGLFGTKSQLLELTATNAAHPPDPGQFRGFWSAARSSRGFQAIEASRLAIPRQFCGDVLKELGYKDKDQVIDVLETEDFGIDGLGIEPSGKVV